MPWADVASLNLTLLCTALVSVVLAGVLLALEFFASQPIARRAPGAMAALLVFLALFTGCFHGTNAIAVASGGLAVVLLLAWPVSFEATRMRICQLYSPKFVWAIVLGVSMIASRYLAAQVLAAFDRGPEPQVVDLEDVPVSRTEALTDLGRVISLFHFKLHSSTAEIERFMELTEKDRTQIIRLIESNPASNCHGWVFTRGKYGIRDEQVESILADNAYIEVNEPREGDLAVFTKSGRIAHTGLVRIADRHAPLLIESKWGPMGVYLHAVDKHPFGGECKFYRSPRADHALTLRPALLVNASATTALRTAE